MLSLVTNFVSLKQIELDSTHTMAIRHPTLTDNVLIQYLTLIYAHFLGLPYSQMPSYGFNLALWYSVMGYALCSLSMWLELWLGS